ncbi:hypothetical protein GPJ56_010999 [Histomonas meleagridis]|uniref:uncharacterized protein n=1 Tax=Histomonas meleagridis TaxID=135588 RepID=UPI00355A50D2|nr:hypothetical protein GPJ56_010999 [Histomonas meleagridis]KAH0800776.1 hypothetical protein GO595_006529 [Histomonas meleagridis]
MSQADAFDYVYRNGKCLSNFDAFTILKNVEADMQDTADSTRKQNFLKACQYVEQFKQFEDGSYLEAARQLVRDFLSNIEGIDEMTEAEHEIWSKQVESDTVTILNLSPKTVEEARSYGLPSLAKIESDEDFQELLSKLDRYRT